MVKNIIIQGKYNNAKVFTNNIEDKALLQIKDVCDTEIFKDSKIRIMPDTHAGAGCTIGTTMTIQDKIVPNLVGVDISCGMLCVRLGNIELDLSDIDYYIRQHIPHGFNINIEPQVDYVDEIKSLNCFKHLNKSSHEFNRAIGSLGGGNHFIELNEDIRGNKYLVIHSGSRNLGYQVAKYYQDLANSKCDSGHKEYNKNRELIISKYKGTNEACKINGLLQELKDNFIPNEVSGFNYLEGQDMLDYLSDIKIMKTYANVNRFTMAKRILKNVVGLNILDLNYFTTTHNYIDVDNMILRKGAVSAKKGEELIIPINMRDGSLVCKGKGNEDWNYSAPHGAGRLMSRTQAKTNIDMNEYRESMKGIFTTSVNKDTLDEAPMAYKSMQEIIDNIQDTVEIVDIIKPIYNFKSS